MDARSVVDALFSKAQKIGQVVFVLIVIAWVIEGFIKHDQKIPPTAYGCYHSEIAPSITINSGKIFVGQDGIGEVASSYQVSNSGPAILTSKSLLLKPVAGGRYQFFVEDRAGRYVRFLPGPPKALEVTAADGMVISYSRVECGGALGTKTR
jgi:hypothetical protein